MKLPEIHRMTRNALLTAVALIIFVVEAQLPAVIPIPGVKLGLANIITVYAMFALGPADTMMILLCRIFLGSVFSGQMMTLMYSLSGGLLCYLVMLPLRRMLTERQIWVSSVLGASAHNVGQILVAIAVTRTPRLIGYLPVLLLSGVISGCFTGLCAQMVTRHMKKLKKT